MTSDGYFFKFSDSLYGNGSIESFLINKHIDATDPTYQTEQR